MTEQPTEQFRERLAAQYDKFAARFHELYDASREKGQQTLDVALDKTREQMAALGEMSAEQAQAFKEYLKRDLDQTAAEMRRLGEEGKARFHPSRVGAGALASLARLLQQGGEALLALSEKADWALIYKSGEVTGAGTLTCLKCGHTLPFAQTAYIPPCPQCNGTTFKKGY
ncbi:MAG: hypothetical protein ABI547_11115 [Betaproteobacteria bacterium]